MLEELTQNDRSIDGITPRRARKALGSYKLFVCQQMREYRRAFGRDDELVENAYRDGRRMKLALVYDTRDLWPDARSATVSTALRQAS